MFRKPGPAYWLAEGSMLLLPLVVGACHSITLIIVSGLFAGVWVYVSAAESGWTQVCSQFDGALGSHLLPSVTGSREGFAHE